MKTREFGIKFLAKVLLVLMDPDTLSHFSMIHSKIQQKVVGGKHTWNSATTWWIHSSKMTAILLGVGCI